jgi:LPXTG-site transpeptidase (sortase) family protein
MQKSKKLKSANLFFLAGAVILLIAGAGIFQTIRQSSTTLEKSAFRYYLKDTPTRVPTSVTQQAQIVEAEVTPTTEVTANIEFYALEPEKEVINSKIRPELSSPNIPTRIVIKKIKLDAPIVVSDFNYTKVDGETFGQWQAPAEFSAGWHPDSALLGQVGNTVINGHHNAYGEVFGKLVDLETGDKVDIYAGTKVFHFIISNRIIVAERFMDTETRLKNAQWLARSNDDRLTLVTCWPKESNTHRLILVARPLEDN